MFGDNWKAAFAAVMLAGSATAFKVDVHSEKSIKMAAEVAAKDAVMFYNNRSTGSQIPGAFPEKWWEGAALFDTLIQYWYFSKDSSHNALVSEGLNWQSGSHHDFLPENFTSYLGNDDQLAWGNAAMTAAEVHFPQKSSNPSWAKVAQNVFDSVAARWDNTSCGGGLRWQRFPYQQGYEMKTASANGAFFQLAARLAHHTKNETYAHWAEKAWTWSASSPLLTTSNWTVADSTSCKNDCSDRSNIQYSLNYATYLTGAAYMHNVSEGSTKWKHGLDGLLNTTARVFFPHTHDGRVLSEVTCEERDNCNNNSKLYKGRLAEDLALVTLVAPSTKAKILPLLQSSAEAAAQTCTGGSHGSLCSQRWYKEKFEGSGSSEEEISALSIFSANLIAFGK